MQDRGVNEKLPPDSFPKILLRDSELRYFLHLIYDRQLIRENR